MSETIDLQDPTAVHEAVVADRLLDLRDQFFVLEINWDYVRESPRTGERLSPKQPPICPNCSIEEDTLLYGPGDIENALFCSSCFDDAHRPEIEAQLSKEMERDFS